MRHILLPAFLISASVQIARSHWKKETGLNCYNGRGATEIDAEPFDSLSRTKCEAKCEEMEACTGVTYEQTSENTLGNCWRRKDINLAQCDRTFGDFDTYVRYKMPPSTTMSPSKPGAYNEETARKFAVLSAISYCDDTTHVRNWNCKACSLSDTPLARGKIRIVDAGVKKATRILVGKFSDQAGCLVSFRGSYTDFNWDRDYQMKLVTPEGYADCKDCKVHYGFYTIWENVREQVVQALGDVGCRESTPDNMLYVTGHSMGAALTQLAMFTLPSQGFSIARTYAFESPRVGNQAFADAFALKFGGASDHLFFTTHAQDPFVHLPLEFQGYKHAQTEVFYDRNAAVAVCAGGDDPSCSNQYWNVPGMLNDHTDDHCNLPFMSFNICAANELGLCDRKWWGRESDGESSDVIV